MRSHSVWDGMMNIGGATKENDFLSAKLQYMKIVGICKQFYADFIFELYFPVN